MIFYLGTHKPRWLEEERFRHVPLFVSRRSLVGRRRLPRALGTWALDSGGFTELTMHGMWSIDSRTYAAEVRRIRDEVGGLAWAAPQDWMCEPIMLARTGLTIEEHQERTVANFLELRERDPDLPFVPVLQGWSITDYWRCADLYERRGVRLAAEPLVGVGTVCRRQGMAIGARIMRTLASGGLRLHGFGFKAQGIAACADVIASADSLAWSIHARRRPPIPGHDLPGGERSKGHRNCANCAEYALDWRAGLLADPRQGRLFVASGGNS